MKKFYSMAAIAIAATMTATAAKPVAADMGQASFTKIEKSVTAIENGAMKVKAAEAPAKKACSVNDLLGTWEWSYYNNLDKEYGKGTVNIEKGDVANQVYVVGILNDKVALAATLDPAAGTLTFVRQKTGLQGTADGNKVDIYFTPGYFGEDRYWHQGQSIVGTFTGESITFIETDAFSFTPPEANGFFFVTQMNEFSYPDYFEYKESEWNDIQGEATYQDGYFNCMMDTPVDAYKVKVKQNIADPNLFMVYDPYQMSLWQGLQTSDKPGYVLFNIENPDCVVMPLLVNSGMVVQIDENLYEATFCFNLEGYRYYALDQWKEDIYDELVSNEMECSNVDGNTVTLYNPFFGLSSKPLGLYQWVDGNKEVIMDPTVIDMPEGWMVGVDEIITDENAPVKLYNLQGMEVVNPEVGTIVIEKKGNKTVKRIVK